MLARETMLGAARLRAVRRKTEAGSSDNAHGRDDAHAGRSAGRVLGARPVVSAVGAQGGGPWGAPPARECPRPLRPGGLGGGGPSTRQMESWSARRRERRPWRRAAQEPPWRAQGRQGGLRRRGVLGLGARVSRCNLCSGDSAASSGGRRVRRVGAPGGANAARGGGRRRSPHGGPRADRGGLRRRGVLGLGARVSRCTLCSGDSAASSGGRRVRRDALGGSAR